VRGAVYELKVENKESPAVQIDQIKPWKEWNEE
jgi:hypothetical protein